MPSTAKFLKMFPAKRNRYRNSIQWKNLGVKFSDVVENLEKTRHKWQLCYAPRTKITRSNANHLPPCFPMRVPLDETHRKRLLVRFVVWQYVRTIYGKILRILHALASGSDRFFNAMALATSLKPRTLSFPDLSVFYPPTTPPPREPGNAKTRIS